MDQRENNTRFAPEQSTPLQQTDSTLQMQSLTNAATSQTKTQQAYPTMPQVAIEQPNAVESKKHKTGLIVLGVVFGVFLLSGITFVVIKALSGSFDETTEIGAENEINNPTGTVAPDFNPIVEASNKMRDELSGFDYIATTVISDKIGDFEMTTNCTYDGNSQLEYCKIDITDGETTEGYYDYINGYVYSLTQSASDYPDTGERWLKARITGSKKGGTPFDETAPITYTKSKSTNEGTTYYGTVKVNMESISSVISGNPDLLPEMELEALINNDGYIKTMNFSVNLGVSSQNTNVVYSNYGNAQSVTIPDDVLNAQEVESLAN